MTTWTTIPQPAVPSWNTIPEPSSGADVVINAGEPIGLLLALTYAVTSITPVENWTIISAPAASSWTTIPNPT